jgi:hypothetical protein
VEPGVTLAMIVKDGGTSLLRCLESVKNVVDRIIVVDTGSQDDSPKIAAEFGAHVLCREWPGRFDAARNMALEEVETEWTLVLDADEWLHEETAPQFRALMGNVRAAGYYLRRFDLYPGGGYGEAYFLRLWRTHPEVRYDALIHEQIHAQVLIAKTGHAEVPTTEVTVWHDGYAALPSVKKTLRDIELLRRQLEETPGEAYFETNLAAALHKVGDESFRPLLEAIMDRFLAESRKGALSSPEFAVAVSGYFETLDLRSIGNDAGGIRRVQEIEEAAWRWFGGSPHVANAIGEFHSRNGGVAGAFNAFYRLAQMAETGQFDRQRSASPALFGEQLWLRLAVVARHSGEVQVARYACQKLLALHPGHSGALEELKLLGG